MVRLKPLLAAAGFALCLPVFAKEMAFKSFDLPHFTKVKSLYQSDLEIIGGSKKPSIVLSGDPVLFPYVKQTVVNGELTIKAPKGVHVIVRPSILESVSVVGEGFVDAKGLNHAQNLEVSITGDIVANIRGPIPIKHAVTVGEANLHLYWLDADHLLLEMRDRSIAKVSGRCDQGEYLLSDQAALDAKWLRCKELAVQSAKGSNALVQATEGLSAYAGGHSLIRYFIEPRRLTTFSSQQGQVLEALHTMKDH